MNIEPYHSDYFNFQPHSMDDPYDEGFEYLICLHGFDDPEELKKVWHLQKSLSHA